MKKIVIALLVVSCFYACELVELEADPASSNVGTAQQKIVAGDITANTEAEAIDFLTGSSEKVWKTVDFTLSTSNSMTDCRLDDEMIFNAHGSYEFFRGLKACGGEDNRSRRIGSWEIDFDNRKLIFDKGNTMEYVSEIIALRDNEFRLKGSYFNLEVRGLFQVK